MKKLVIKLLDINPEIISRLSDEQAEEIYGGISCVYNSCKPGRNFPKPKKKRVLNKK